MNPLRTSVSRYLKDEWLRSCHRKVGKVLIAAHEAPQLFPRSDLCAPKIETAHAVLFDGRAFRRDVVKFSVVAENNPAALPDLAKPLIVGRILIEAAMLMPFNGKRRIGLQDGERKARPEAPIKIEG